MFKFYIAKQWISQKELRLDTVLYPWHLIKFVNSEPAWKWCISPENPVQAYKNWGHSYILLGSKAFMSAAWTQLCLFQYVAKRQNATWDFNTFQGPSAMKTHLSLWQQVCYWSKMVKIREKKGDKKREKDRRNNMRKKATKGKNAGEKRTINPFFCCSSSCICEQLSQLLVKLYLTCCQHEFSKNQM